MRQHDRIIWRPPHPRVEPIHIPGDRPLAERWGVALAALVVLLSSAVLVAIVTGWGF